MVMETHVQTAGQSESTLQVVALGWQYPGNDVVVVHVVVGSLVTVPPSTLSGGVGATAGRVDTAAPPAPDADPPPPDVPADEVPVAGGGETPETVPFDEHEPPTDGLQTKSAPQSLSALHGNCHL